MGKYYIIISTQLQRFRVQFFVLKTIIRNFQPEVENYISFEKGADCLDIGCGPGTFLMDMASDYPKSTFVGVDIAAMVNVNFKLPNVSFVLGNVVEGLNFPDNSFDYIQLRVFVNALRNEEWPIALKEIYRLLKPGGCAGFFEYEPRVSGKLSKPEKIFNYVLYLCRILAAKIVKKFSEQVTKKLR
jgi:ubiquinone/menaquinone biosynthesis C-methylase UbiE